VIQEGIVARLLADPGVAAIAGGNIFAMLAPDESLLFYPCVSYALVGGSQELTFTNFGYRQQRIELNAHALSYAAAAQLRAAVIVALQDWKQILADGTDIIGTNLVNPGIDFLGEDRIFRCLVEFYVNYNSPN
jgi:hypothetical protein